MFKRKILTAGMLFIAACAMTACGSTRTERGLSGAGIGAGLGAAGSAISGGSPVTGAVVGGAVGGAAGALTDKNDIDLNDWFD